MRLAHWPGEAEPSFARLLLGGAPAAVLDGILGRRPAGLKRALDRLPVSVLLPESYRHLIELLDEPAIRQIHLSHRTADGRLHLLSLRCAGAATPNCRPGSRWFATQSGRPDGWSAVPRLARGRIKLRRPGCRAQCALHTLIHQRHLTPSCGGHAPTAERTVGPARNVLESLTPRPGIREQHRPEAVIGVRIYTWPRIQATHMSLTGD
jgi:hypothetical protein